MIGAMLLDEVIIIFFDTDYITHKDSKQTQTMLLQNNSSRESCYYLYIVCIKRNTLAYSSGNIALIISMTLADKS